MSIPRSIRTQISTDGNLRRNQGRYREDTEAVMQAKRSGDYRSRSVRRPYPHAHQRTAEVQHITDNGISKGEEQSNDIRPARQSQVQVRK